ncbi:MAG: SecY-interacting protein Syd [Pseudomonadales bacterium]|nr:SecY-interacting protein Syd [Pseudomonadales bacterium]|tara:strand:- start:761 stop:1339 length:579 start_codon:yes stop_codon:yes gene_type:complete
MGSIQLALSELIDNALRLTDEGVFYAEYDQEWRSPCELPAFENKNRTQAPELVAWRPVPQTPPVDFSGLENALETTIHPDIVEYFSSFWSSTIEAKSIEGHASLIQLWNQGDFDRLVENFIGHALAKRQLKEPLTLFIATTEADSEYFLSINNATGAVLLEEPGRPPLRQVEDSLETFLRRLTPSTSQPVVF